MYFYVIDYFSEKVGWILLFFGGMYNLLCKDILVNNVWMKKDGKFYEKVNIKLEVYCV